MWACPTCGSTNQLDACWQCRRPRPASASDLPPPPSWYPAPSAPRRSGWWAVAVVGLAVAVVAILLVAVVRPVVQLGSPTVALAAPSSIDGLPKTGDFSSQPVTVLGRHILDVASATYGVGDVYYAVVAISGPAAGSDPNILVPALAPQVAGADTLDRSSATHLARSGVDYTCWRMNGAVAGVNCMWNAGGVSGLVVQLGSTDMARCADFADVARGSVQRHA